MDKKETLREFLKHGVMPSPEDLERVNENNYEQILHSYIDQPPTTEIPKQVQVVAESLKEESKPDSSVSVSVIRPEKKKRASVYDFTNMYKKRYEILRDIILKKTQAISINKVPSVSSEICVIGVVKETGERSFVIEDTTGSIEVVAETSSIETDDIIGVKGIPRDGKLIPKEIVFPDISLANKPATANVDIILNQDKEHRAVTAAQNKAVMTADIEWILIKSGDQETLLLFYGEQKTMNKNEATLLLRKRSLPYKIDRIQETTIEQAPNIFWLASNDANWKENYKGVVIISTDNASSAEYNPAKDRIIFKPITI
jgi:hypothetical protein